MHKIVLQKRSFAKLPLLEKIEVIIISFGTRLQSTPDNFEPWELPRDLRTPSGLSKILETCRVSRDLRTPLPLITGVCFSQNSARLRPNIELFVRRTNLSELSPWKVWRLAHLSLSELVWIVQHVLSVCFTASSANGSNIVGQQLPTLSHVTCFVRLHTLSHVVVCCWELLH